MGRRERTFVVGFGLIVFLALLPWVFLASGMQDWVAATAFDAGVAKTMTHYGVDALIIYLALGFVGLACGGWWIFKPTKPKSAKSSY